MADLLSRQLARHDVPTVSGHASEFVTVAHDHEIDVQLRRRISSNSLIVGDLTAPVGAKSVRTDESPWQRNTIGIDRSRS